MRHVTSRPIFIRVLKQFKYDYGADDSIKRIEECSLPIGKRGWIYAIKVVAKEGCEEELKLSLPKLYNGVNVVVEEEDE